MTDCPILQAVRKKGEEDKASGSVSTADFILLDTFHQEQYGGTGQSFDTELIPEGYRPYFLAGGITAETVSDAIRDLRPFAVDVSSSVETDGYKDYEKVKEFIKKVRETK